MVYITFCTVALLVAIHISKRIKRKTEICGEKTNAGNKPIKQLRKLYMTCPSECNGSPLREITWGIIGSNFILLGVLIVLLVKSRNSPFSSTA